MKHDDERLEQLLQSRTFSELTSDEKEFVVATLGSEEAFTAMKGMDESLSQSSRSQVQPDRKTLDSVVKTMRELHQAVSLWERFVAVRIPAYAALLMLIVPTGLTLLLRAEPTERIIAGRDVLKVDTVFVTKRDTIFTEKVIYTMVKTPQVHGKKQIDAVPETVPVGVSMKEKDELNKLLVSGSD